VHRSTAYVSCVAGPNSSIVLVVAAEPHDRQSGDAEGLPLLLPQVGERSAGSCSQAAGNVSCCSKQSAVRTC
jgi:hypothetical protein